MTALREIKLLREINNPYIARLLDVFPHKRNLSLVRNPSPSAPHAHLSGFDPPVTPKSRTTTILLLALAAASPGG